MNQQGLGGCDHTYPSESAATDDTAARLKALDPDCSFCVTAPAGSGKTELLTQRLLALLARVERPEQVLAITFTRKAAAEMRDRVLEKLAEARATLPVTESHEKITRELALRVLDHATARGWSLQPEQFNIRTIDSLCSELTRQMPILSALGGALTTTEDPETLFEHAVTELLTQLGDPGLTGEALRALLLHFDNDWSRVTTLLIQLLGRRGDWAPYLGQHRHPEQAEAALRATVDDLVASVIERVAAYFGPQCSELAELANYAADQLGYPPVTLGTTAESLISWRQIVALLLKDDGQWRKPRGISARQGFPPKTHEKERLIAILESVEDTPVPEDLITLLALPVMADDEPGWQLVLHLSHLLPVLLAELLLVFQRQGVVDFTHIALAAAEALGDDDNPTDLALRLDFQLEHILVDEFQDTSDQQFELLRRLSRGWAEHNASGARPRTLFIVGDGMQSIYGFRYANVGLFLRARDEGIGGLHLESLALTRNFRSQAGLVHWVNSVFAQLLPPDDAPERGRVKHTAAQPTRPALANEAVSVRLFPEDQGEDEAQFIADQITRLRRDEPSASVAILVRARGHAETIIEALRRAELPFVGRDLESLVSSTAVIDLLSLCRWLANPADDVAALALLRAPFCGLSLADIHALLDGVSRPIPLRAALRQAADSDPSERQRRCAHLLAALDWAQQKRDRLMLSVWIEQTWLRLGGPQVLSMSARGDALRFFDLLRQAEQDGRGLDMYWLEQQVGRLYAEHEAAEHAIELMTLHKSKGLEFDYVFMPALHKTPRVQDRELLRWHLHQSKRGQGLLIAADDRTSGDQPTLYNYLNSLQKQKDEAELRRLLYVGVTRARYRVWLTARVSARADAIPTDSTQVPDSATLRWPSPATPLGAMRAAIAQQVVVQPLPTSSSQIRPPLIGPLLRRLPDCALTTAREVDVDSIATGTNPIDRASLLQSDSHMFERHIGTVTHRILELLAGAETLPFVVPSRFRAAAIQGLRRAGIPMRQLEAGVERVLDMISTMLTDPTGRWILDRHTYAQSEFALLVAGPDGVSSRYVLDRTFVTDSAPPAQQASPGDTASTPSGHGFASDRGIRWVIDYKTSRPATGEALMDFAAREAARYGQQLKQYQRILSHVEPLGIPIRVALYFPAVPLWYPLAP